MEKDLKTKIAEDIQKSGFGSEMKALKILRAAGWTATGLAYYTDLESNSTRETDIKAHLCIYDETKDDKDSSFTSFFGLSIEVKKTEKPWVVFKEQPTYSFEVLEGHRSLYFVDGLNPKLPNGIPGTIQKSGLAKEIGWFGNGLHESFKSPDQSSRWYSAFVSVCKASEEALKENSWTVDKVKHSDQTPYLWFNKPLIVIDGNLFSATLDEKTELVITEEEMCSVKFVFKNEHYTRGEYFVDLVTLSALNKYLEFCSKRNAQFAAALKRHTQSTG